MKQYELMQLLNALEQLDKAKAQELTTSFGGMVKTAMLAALQKD